MIPLDISTVLVLHMTSLIAGAMGFIHLRQQSLETKGLALLAAAFLGLAAGSFSAGLGERDVLPAWLWQPGSLAIGSLSYACLWLGARALSSGRGLRRPWILLLLPIAWLCLAAITNFSADNQLRASAFHITAFLFLLASAREVARDQRIDPLPSRRPLTVIFGLAAVVYAVEFLMMTLGRISVPTIALGFGFQTFCNFGITILVYGVVKERAENALRLAAEIDSLTGIGNRRWMDARMPGVIRRGDTIMMLDLDHFKTINDRYGHAAGDHVLRAFADEVNRNLRPQDRFARTGGEEFVLYMPGLSLADAKAAGERLCRLVESLAIQHRGDRIPVTTSLGVAWSDGGYPSWDLMLQAADTALYTAKKAGRNQVAVQPSPLSMAPVA